MSEVSLFAYRLCCVAFGIAVLATPSGCSTAFKESYHVGVFQKRDGQDIGVAQFYRFRLEGASSFFSNTRYEAGWYDADVIDRLFGEVRDKRVVAAGTSERRITGAVDEIPLLFAGADAIGKDSITATRAVAHSRAGPVLLTVDRIIGFRAAKISIQFNAERKITSLKATGGVHVKAHKGLPSRLLFLDLTPSSGGGRVEVLKPTRLDISGGTVTITTQAINHLGERRSGTVASGSTQSLFHGFEWTGGAFEMLNGTTVESFHHITGRGSLTRIDKPDKVTASAGWLLRLKGAVAQAGSITFALRNPDAAVEVKIDPAHPLDPTSIVFDGDTNDRYRAAVSGGKSEFVAQDAALSCPAPGLPLPTAIIHEVSDFELSELTVESGAYSLTATHAVEQAQATGASVSLRDAGNETFYHFGPEGVSNTRRESERLVVFMTASPRVLVNRIRALVNSKLTQQVVAAAIFAPKLVEQQRDIKKAERSAARMKALADEMATAVAADGFTNRTRSELLAKAIGWIGQSGADPTGLTALLGLITTTVPSTQPSSTETGGGA